MTALRFILLSQSVLAIFIAGGLFFSQQNVRSRSISIFILLFGIEMFYFLFATSDVLFLFPQFSSSAYFPFGFLYGPLFYIHILSLLEKPIIAKKLIFHFVPSVMIVILMSDMYAMDGMDRILYVSENFINRIMPYNYARATHILFYGIVCGVMVRKHKFKDGLERIYSIAICIIYFLAAVLISFYTEFASGWRQFIYYYLFANSIVLIIGYILYSKPDFLKDLSKKYFSSSLNKEIMEQVKARIHDKVVNSKAYLDRGLNLKVMSELTGESTHRISQTMSVLVGKNFNDYINHYRVEHAKDMLLDAKYDHFKIEAIAIDSGFNNKVTFHKAFVKLTGETPSVFRESGRKKSH